MALDRIVEFQQLEKEIFIEHKGIDFDRYFDDLLGVTKSERDRAHRVILRIDKYNAPYILTKPLHHSQQILKEDELGLIIRIDVILNFELEREILGFGECMEVLSPRNLVSRIRRRLEQAARKYHKESPSD